MQRRTTPVLVLRPLACNRCKHHETFANESAARAGGGTGQGRERTGVASRAFASPRRCRRTLCGGVQSPSGTPPVQCTKNYYYLDTAHKKLRLLGRLRLLLRLLLLPLTITLTITITVTRAITITIGNL